MINQKQYRRLLREYARTKNMSLSALSADVDLKTARKYVQSQHSPEQLRKPHTWRTRADPLAAVWPEAERRLRASPELEATALFEHLHAGQAADLPAKFRHGKRCSCRLPAGRVLPKIAQHCERIGGRMAGGQHRGERHDG